MQFPPEAGRWPPVYDYDELEDTIKQLSNITNLRQFLYIGGSYQPPYSQGDIIWLESRIPVIWKDGAPGTIDGHGYWMVLGNSCDLDRPITEVEWCQLAPVFCLGTDDDVSGTELDALKKYRYSRHFYLPGWAGEQQSRHFIANFLEMTPIHREGLVHASPVTRLSQRGWYLLHSCIVRFLARSDGRNDP